MGEREVGKQRRYNEKLEWKMKKDAEVMNDSRMESRKGNHKT